MPLHFQNSFPKDIMAPKSTISKSDSAPKRPWLDFAAVGLSTLCIIHCLLLPVIVAFAPMIAEPFGGHIVHQILVLFAIPTTLWALMTRKNVSLYVYILVCAGLSGLCIAAFYKPVENIETYITVFSAVLVMLGHIYNLQNIAKRRRTARKMALIENTLA